MSHQHAKYDVIIIGAGAAGMLCAITAAQRGQQVLVLDHANKAGKKILMSGGGRCNFTNLHTHADCFISRNSRFCKSALSRYKPQDFIDLVSQHDIPYHEKKLGQLFCDRKSKDIVVMLLSECQQANATIQLNTDIHEISKVNDTFILATSKGQYNCQSLVIATGGLSIPTMGASPFGYRVAQQFGINVWPTRAGLVPFTWHQHDKERFGELSGVSLACRVRCHKQVFEEDMLFTHRGLSGPAMLQISSYWNPGDTLEINLYPQADLLSLLKKQHQQGVNCSIKNLLNQYFPARVVSTWLLEQDADKKLQDCSFALLKSIADSFQKWQLKPNATEGYRTAEVTLGGIDCDAISSQTMEAKAVPGLYFIGEVLDVTGWLGGYNFQWAWASGYVAGLSLS